MTNDGMFEQTALGNLCTAAAEREREGGIVIGLPWHTLLLRNGIKNVKGMQEERIN